MAKLYDEKSIESLSPLEFTRLRPGVYAGDCTYSTQLLIEIFSNSVDEFNAGHGNIINVTIDKDVVTVEDRVAYKRYLVKRRKIKTRLISLWGFYKWLM